SGAYLASLRGIGLGETNSSERRILFVVKRPRSGKDFKILFHVTTSTFEVYNPWGGKSLYDYNSSGRAEADIVSFERPFDEGVIDGQLLGWQEPFIKWCQGNGFEIDYCASTDLHADASLLECYQLLLSVGHDEYWSKEMRDNIEAFIANGGNVAFFSGNVCYWQVRFDRDDTR